MRTYSVEQMWSRCLVVAPGPSLTDGVASKCVGVPVLVVQDAYRKIPWADVLYGCDTKWWNHVNGAEGFKGEKWTSHDVTSNRKNEIAPKYGLKCVMGSGAENEFSRDPGMIYYGSNSGFQAVNLAILFGATDIGLVGFDMQKVCGKTHFFGDHPAPLGNPSFPGFIRAFEEASKKLEGVNVVNLTPESALKCFPMGDLDEFLNP